MSRRGVPAARGVSGGGWGAGWRALWALCRQAGVQYRWRQIGVKAAPQVGQGVVVSMSLRMSLRSGGTVRSPLVGGMDGGGAAGGGGDRVVAVGFGADTIAAVGVRGLGVTTRGWRQWPARRRTLARRGASRVAWGRLGPWPWSGSAVGR